MIWFWVERHKKVKVRVWVRVNSNTPSSFRDIHTDIVGDESDGHTIYGNWNFIKITAIKIIVTDRFIFFKITGENRK